MGFSRPATQLAGDSPLAGSIGQFARKVIQSPAPGVPYRKTYDPNGPIWIFHPRSLLWMGKNDGSLHGKAMGEVVLKRAIVDRLGQRPRGH
jgi:hypothetical protein